jgi:H+/gluconate symporter-like permease
MDSGLLWVLFDRPAQDELFSRLQQCRADIAASVASEDKDPGPLITTLNHVIFEVHRIHFEIATQQDFLEFKHHKARGWLFVAVILLYVAIIVAIIFYEWNSPKFLMVPMIGIPVSVVIWSLLGSLAAILYRFYNYSRIRKLYKESTWLIARPLTGVIMGMLSYLIIVAGLFIFGTASQASNEASHLEASNETSQITSHLHDAFFWVVAFISGLSIDFIWL